MNDIREIRVFISSTFRDMMGERDVLVKEIFPALRRKCAGRFVTFTEVDLRWGITTEQAAEGQVLPICLAEIQRCRPYFLGLLGERYGWIPDEIPAEVLAREPWLQQHVQGRTSVTELEILHGVLNDPAMRTHAFFYFRDPAYLPAGADPTDFRETNPDKQAKLAALKERIRAGGLPVAEHYADPDALGELVRAQFDALIDELYPEAEVPDPLDREAEGHAAYARQKLFACIDRPVHLAALTAYAEGERDGQGLVVTGESGGGKTALLAAWARDWAAAYPDDFLLQHYFGATAESASPDGFLRRLLGELKRRFDISDDIPADPEELREALPLWLAQTVNKGRIILILDGLNQVQGSDPDRRLAWLPRMFPANVTVLASALPGPALDALRALGWREHDVPRADAAEIDAMIQAYLGEYRRDLGPALRRQLVDAPGTNNLLFLRAVLEELRQFGSFEQLPARLAHYLAAETPRDLFVRVLRRWAEDFDAGRDLVRRAVTHLWAARQGLAEAEWLELLADAQGPMPRQTWSPLFLALEPHLAQHAGLYAFGHDFLRQAVEVEYLPDKDTQHAAHLALADYFEAQPEIPPRKAAEWPWQLHAAQSWDRLEACLTDIPLFLALYNNLTMWELTGYWHHLRRIGRDMGECYVTAYGQWNAVPANADDHYVSGQLGNFLHINGLYPAAEPLLARALQVSERVMGPEHPDTLTRVNDLAGLLKSIGDYGRAEPLYQRVLETRELVLGSEHPDTLRSVNDLACLRDSSGNYTGAEPLYRRALATREQVLGPEHPSTLISVNDLAVLLFNIGDYAGAEPLYRRALTLQERILGPEHPDTLQSVNNLAALLAPKGDYSGAEPLYRRALAARERVLGPDHPDTLTSVNNLAFLLSSIGDNAGAEPLYRRALAVGEQVLGPEHPFTLIYMHNLAFLLWNIGDNTGAEPLYQRALAAQERVLGPEHPDTLRSMNSLAALLTSKGDYAGAEPLYRRSFETRKQVLGPTHPSTLNVELNLLSLLHHTGRAVDAERVQEITAIFNEANHPWASKGRALLASLGESE